MHVIDRCGEVLEPEVDGYVQAVGRVWDGLHLVVPVGREIKRVARR